MDYVMHLQFSKDKWIVYLPISLMNLKQYTLMTYWYTLKLISNS